LDTQTSGRTCRLGILGAGNLAGGVIRGLLHAEFCSVQEIIASQPDDELRRFLQEETGITVTAGNLEVAQQAEIIFVGVKPAIVRPVLQETAAYLKDKLVISFAAGIRLASMEPIAEARFMRAMTNTPAAICRGATAIARGTRTTEDDVMRAREILSAVGIVVEVPEKQIDAVTALSGSGPAFVYTLIEALADGGTKSGLSPEVALALATQTILGAAELVQTSGHSPEELRRMVITPGGTTAAGLAVMEKEKTASGLSAAVEAAAKRGREMAQENL
jgi:pyrroline-5-carboxylate reductase